jgi:hypothetical protein
MTPWFACTGAELLGLPPDEVAARLAATQISRRLPGEPAQLDAWRAQVAILQAAVREAGGQSWRIAFEYELLRLEKRIDAVLLTDRAILVLEFKAGATKITAAFRAQAEDYAQDLLDFHALSRAHPIIPIVVAARCEAPAPLQAPLPLPGVHAVAEAGAASLPSLLQHLDRVLPSPATKLDGAAWCAAPYRPVPSIVEAAATLFARNSVAEIAAARADTANLTRTTDAIERALREAREAGGRVVVFVTGIPGAGKTLCGLNVVFGETRREGTAFLTGNAPLVAVLREALACNRAGLDLPPRTRRGPAAPKPCGTAAAGATGDFAGLAECAPLPGRQCPPPGPAGRARDRLRRSPARLGCRPGQPRHAAPRQHPDDERAGPHAGHHGPPSGLRRHRRPDRPWAGDQHRRGRPCRMGRGDRGNARLARRGRAPRAGDDGAGAAPDARAPALAAT